MWYEHNPASIAHCWSKPAIRASFISLLSWYVLRSPSEPNKGSSSSLHVVKQHVVPRRCLKVLSKVPFSNDYLCLIYGPNDCHSYEKMQSLLVLSQNFSSRSQTNSVYTNVSKQTTGGLRRYGYQATARAQCPNLGLSGRAR